jgi:hypothetical protein
LPVFPNRESLKLLFHPEDDLVEVDFHMLVRKTTETVSRAKKEMRRRGSRVCFMLYSSIEAVS